MPPSGDLVGTGDEHYYQAHSMTRTGNAGEFAVTLQAQKTGAYRLTARYQTMGAPGQWMYFTGDGRRDHVITVSPKAARDMVLYELNTIVIESTLEGTAPSLSSRSTFDDLLGAPETFTDGTGKAGGTMASRSGIRTGTTCSTRRARGREASPTPTVSIGSISPI